MNISNKQKIRFLFWGSIVLSSYGLAITFLFHDHELITSLISVFIFFCAFHFFYLELYKFHRKYIAISLGIGFIITGFLISPQTTAMRVANIGFHGMIGLLAYSLYYKTEKSLNFSGTTYFSTGGYLFTIALSLVYSTIIVNFFSEFPMDCKQLNQQSNKVIGVITSPFKMSREKTQDITKSTKTFFSSTFGDLFEASKSIEIKQAPPQNTLLNKIKNRKEELIIEPIRENERLNNTICDYTLKTINEKLQSPKVQYPVIILILFLIYPFIRVVVRTISFVGLAIFEICYLFGLYTKQKKMVEGERIE